VLRITFNSAVFIIKGNLLSWLFFI